MRASLRKRTGIAIEIYGQEQPDRAAEATTQGKTISGVEAPPLAPVSQQPLASALPAMPWFEQGCILELWK